MTYVIVNSNKSLNRSGKIHSRSVQNRLAHMENIFVIGFGGTRVLQPQNHKIRDWTQSKQKKIQNVSFSEDEEKKQGTLHHEDWAE